jgi:tetratricopeptide (TPR) repeat protein
MEWDDSIKNPEKERQRLEQLVKEKPDDADGYYDLAVVCEYLNDDDKAIEYCEKAISLYPYKPLYYAFLVFLTTRFDTQKAMDALVKFIEFVPDESDYYTERVIDELAYVDCEIAIKYIENLIAQGKEHIAHKMQGWIWNP